MSFQPRTRLQKILMGIAATPRTALEHAVKYAVENGGGGAFHIPFTVVEEEGKLPVITTTAVFADVKAEYLSGKTLIADVDVGEGVIIELPTMSVVNKNDPAAFVFAKTFNAAVEESAPLAPQYFTVSFAANGVDFDAVFLAIKT